MKSKLNTDLLSGMVKSKRGNLGLRIIAKEIGDISPTTLSRIEQGKIPDVDTFIKICDWLEVSTDTFITKSMEKEKDISDQEYLIAHLRANRELSEETIDMLVRIIDMAYQTK